MISFIKYNKIAFVWWGTGWHVTPIVAIVREHKNVSKVNLNYIWLWGKDSLEEREAAKEDIAFFKISTIKLSTVFSPKIILYPFILVRGVFQARKILLQQKPDIIFSKWGPWSVAVGIASWLLMIPLWIHESDTVPGWSNRFLWHIAERIFLWFETARKFFRDEKCTVVWQIINPDILKPAKDYRYWKTEKTHIFVICWSQWSRNIFEAISKTCKYIDVEWIILLGILNKDSRWLFQDFPHATVYDWIDAHTIGSMVDKADLIITRGSATSLAELDLFKKRKIIVPYSWSAQNHQFYNAMWYKENRGDVVLDDNELMDNLQKTITNTLTHDAIAKKMDREDNFLR